MQKLRKPYLVLLDTNFFSGGAFNFSEIAGGDTVYDLGDIDPSDALLDLVGEDLGSAFFGANLFGGS